MSLSSSRFVSLFSGFTSVPLLSSGTISRSSVMSSIGVSFVSGKSSLLQPTSMSALIPKRIDAFFHIKKFPPFSGSFTTQCVIHGRLPGKGRNYPIMRFVFLLKVIRRMPLLLYTHNHSECSFLLASFRCLQFVAQTVAHSRFCR